MGCVAHRILKSDRGYVARILFWQLIAKESADRLQLVTGIDLDRSVIGESEIGKAAARRSALDAPSSTATGAPRTETAGEIAATIWEWSSPKGGAIMATGEAKVIDNAIIGFMQRRRCSPTPI
jgi:hypothetical protein